MAFRGRGRGRGGFGGGGFRYIKPEPFELFPEIKELGTASRMKLDKSYASWNFKLYNFWSSSPYYLDDENGAPGNTQSADTDMERYSDKISGPTKRKTRLSDFIRMELDYLPAELAKGEKKVNRESKRSKWNPDAGMKKFELFEKLEQKKGEGEEEEEEEEEIVEEDDEYSDDGDYNQNCDFDDDEDDFNMEEDIDEGPTL